MTPEEWQQVKDLFQAALQHEPSERANFLDQACSGNSELRHELESLLVITHHTKLNAFVRYPEWSPLGNQIVYEYAEQTGNIWMIDLKD